MFIIDCSRIKNLNISNQELEESCLQMKIENDRLREVSEVAKNQVEMFEGRKQEQNLEIVILKFISIFGLLCHYKKQVINVSHTCQIIKRVLEQDNCSQLKSKLFYNQFF